jgi:alpha-glucosidase (family GH31 glycosyl hydrolase)
MDLADHLVPDVDPVADPDAVVEAGDVRVTVLGPHVVRLEYDPDAGFEDRPTQTVWYRDHPVPDFDVSVTEDRLEVSTDALAVRYDQRGEGFAPGTLSVHVADTGTVWRYGDDPTGNLGGAVRTLDRIEGPTTLDAGLVSRDGWAVLEDTGTPVFGDDGWLHSRSAHDDAEDLYVFGYGHDYPAALSAFTALAGPVPLVPRWALGNWWSRYREYSAAELRELLSRFREEGVPLSVCVVDMDWHVVDNEYTDGWTGWTWNEDLFPDPEGFLSWVHDQGLRATLNVHPAGGVHPHEAAYESFASFVGTDPASEEPVEFDAADARFLNGYVGFLIHPREAEGVDFWWVDWQQWEESPSLTGLDPLWALNHVHALDRTRDGRRPFLLSRWPGLGGHRYPAGFSGDAIASWDSLAFQPHLTATGGNAGCDWWSHDVGGHFGGTGTPETFGDLYVRWAQFGALSPVNRVHTGNVPFIDKLPWSFDATRREALLASFRLRHALVPYLYSMARRTHETARPLCEPLYYSHPETEAAYHCPGQYRLGTDLLAAPHVRPRDPETNLARTTVWLPDGADWFDVHSGARYASGFHARYGGIDDVPLYARAGAVVPLDGGVPVASDPAGNAGDGTVQWGVPTAPDRVRLLVFPGADGGMELYEDDGDSLAHREGAAAVTDLSQTWEGDRLAVEVGPVRGDRSLVPDAREYVVSVRGVVPPGDAGVDVAVEGTGEDAGGDGDGAGDNDDGAESAVAYDDATATLSVTVADVGPGERVRVVLRTEAATLLAAAADTLERVHEALRHLELPARAKGRIESYAREVHAGDRTDLDWLGRFSEVTTPAQVRAIVETLCDVGVAHVDHDGHERLVAWNGTGRGDATYRHTRWDRGGVPLSDEGTVASGPLPAFLVVDPDDNPRDDWRFAVSYGGELAATFSGEGEAPGYDGSP